MKKENFISFTQWMEGKEEDEAKEAKEAKAKLAQEIEDEAERDSKAISKAGHYRKAQKIVKSGLNK